MGRYLASVLRAGARPIGRRTGPVRRGPMIPVRDIERVATPREAPVAPAERVSAPPPVKAEPLVAEPEPPVRTPEPEPEPVNAEVAIAPAATQEAAPPGVAKTEPKPEPATVEAQVETIEMPAFALPQPIAPVIPAAPPEHVRAPQIPAAETPSRKAPPPRIPAPREAETKQEKPAGAATERLIAHRDMRPPQWPGGPPAPRVEFITTERVITLLPKGQPAEREQAARRAEPAPAPRSESPREKPVLPAPMTVKADVKAAAIPAPPPPAPRREAVTPAIASPAAPTPLMPTVRREPDNSIHIRNLDIQIVTEEPRTPVRRTRPATPARENPPRGFEFHYLREVV